MATVRRPSLLSRTLSTPPLTPTSAAYEHRRDGHVETPLTPPISPQQVRPSSVQANASNCFEPLTLTERAPERSTELVREFLLPNDGNDVLSCPFDVELLLDQCGRDQVFGQGAWSNVYKATTHVRSSDMIGLPSPPASPTSSSPLVVAVKRPARRDAELIIWNEAKVLSYLSRVPKCGDYIVPFYGFLDTSHSVVMEALPLSLEEYIRKCSVAAQASLTTWNMSQPVLGSTRVWLDLARRLVSALSWLHDEAEVVHGDIKPGNLLLRPDTMVCGFPFQPVFIDFTSSQLLGNGEVSHNTLSAVTREYTAPELLASKVLRDPASTATKASDVFSLAVTLITAASGDVKVYPGSVFRRQAMASQGWQVLNFVRSGDQGARLSRHGIVEKVVERAVLKADMGRISASRWKGLIEEMMQGEPQKGDVIL